MNRHSEIVQSQFESFPTKKKVTNIKKKAELIHLYPIDYTFSNIKWTKILDFLVPSVEYYYKDDKRVYFIDSDWPVFSCQGNTKKLFSLTKNRKNRQYSIRFVELIKNQIIYPIKDEYTKKWAYNDEAFMNAIYASHEGDPTNRKVQAFDEIAIKQNLNALFVHLAQFREFSYSLMKVIKIDYIENPWTPQSIADKKMKEFNIYKAHKLLPNYNLKLKITGTDCLGLITKISFSEDILDHLEIREQQIENHYNNPKSIYYLKSKNWIKFYIMLLKFFTNLNVMSLKLDNNVQHLSQDSNEEISGNFEIFKSYYYHEKVWWLHVLFVFHPDFNQFQIMNDFNEQKNKKIDDHVAIEKKNEKRNKLAKKINEIQLKKKIKKDQKANVLVKSKKNKNDKIKLKNIKN